MLSRFQSYIRDLTNEIPNWDSDVLEILSEEVQLDDNDIKKE